MRNEDLLGQCSCGDIRYRMMSKPLFVNCCHCRWCQRETGSAFAINAMIEADRVVLLSGTPEIVLTPSSSGKGQRITRCPKCRIALWSNYAGAGDATGSCAWVRSTTPTSAHPTSTYSQHRSSRGSSFRRAHRPSRNITTGSNIGRTIAWNGARAPCQTRKLRQGPHLCRDHQDQCRRNPLDFAAVRWVGLLAPKPPAESAQGIAGLTPKQAARMQEAWHFLDE